MGKQDNIYEKGNLSGLPFTFNEEVTEVFGDMIERASLNTNLLPGDYIGSGTVGTGCILELRPENTDGWIEKGDKVTLTVERLGSLENKIV